MISLDELLARVEKAEGPDRELDRDLARAFGWTETDTGNDWRDVNWNRPDGFRLPIGTLAEPPFFTASLDAALALCERVLPGWSWMLRGASASGGQDFAKLWRPYQTPPGNDFDAFGKSPPLALLAAMLKALIAQAASPESGPTSAREEPRS